MSNLDDLDQIALAILPILIKISKRDSGSSLSSYISYIDNPWEEAEFFPSKSDDLFMERAIEISYRVANLFKKFKLRAFK